jgi:HEAT repeat protein
VPVLIELLSHEDAGVRIIAVYALGRIGPDARVAVPAIMSLIEETERSSADLLRWIEQGSLSEEAVKALKRIDPEAAVRVGKK